MDDVAKKRVELVCAYAGFLFLVTFVLCWGWFGMNLPLPAGANLSAGEIARHYVENSVQIRIGFVLAAIMIGLYMPWSVVMTTRLMRIEGQYPVLSYLQLIGGALTVMVVSFSLTFWIVAGFRPDRNVEITQTLHDLGWLTIDQLYICTTIQMFAAAVAGLFDKSKQPLLPRWACWFAIWAGCTFFPASLTAFLTTGVFAWNGFASYYFPYIAWLAWFLIFTVYMVRAIKNDPQYVKS